MALLKDFKTVVQIFAGGFNNSEAEFDQIKERLQLVLSKTNINKVIIGWARDRELYNNLKSYLKPLGIEMVLWLPVFSETGLLKASAPVLDYKGRKIESYNLQEGESFDFYCPTNSQNIGNVIKIFEEDFADCGFDGVFLDKIRYPSFANGLNSVFTCFCKDCINKMEAEGLDTGNLIAEIDKLYNWSCNPDNKNPFGIEGYASLSYIFQGNSIWKEFFDFKARNISSSVSFLYKYFKEKGLGVGLDLFSPFMGYFTGQQVSLLKDWGDFIKPMLYRTVNAPAGLPFELNCFLRELSFNNRLLYETLEDSMLNNLGIDGYDGKLMPASFVSKELGWIQGYGGETEVLPGIEVNRIDVIAPVYPGSCRESIGIVKESGAAGVVLSWNLLSMPDENLEAVLSASAGE